MLFMLDTNICIALIKHQPPKVLKRLETQSPGEVGLSTVTLGELRYGVEKSRAIDRNQRALEEFLLPLEIFDFDEKAAAAYGSVRAFLESSGKPIGPLDTQIGAHALSLGAALVTNNTREFARIPNLKVINWME